MTVFKNDDVTKNQRDVGYFLLEYFERPCIVPHSWKFSEPGLYWFRIYDSGGGLSPQKLFNDKVPVGDG